jgi:hypothetical protein
MKMKVSMQEKATTAANGAHSVRTNLKQNAILVGDEDSDEVG